MTQGIDENVLLVQSIYYVTVEQSSFQRKNELNQTQNQDKSWGVSGFRITI